MVLDTSCAARSTPSAAGATFDARREQRAEDDVIAPVFLGTIDFGLVVSRSPDQRPGRQAGANPPRRHRCRFEVHARTGHVCHIGTIADDEARRPVTNRQLQARRQIAQLARREIGFPQMNEVHAR